MTTIHPTAIVHPNAHVHPSVRIGPYAVIDGDVETGSVMAGQSVGMVTREQPTAEIIAEILHGSSIDYGHRGKGWVAYDRHFTDM